MVKIKTVGVKDLKNHLSAYLRDVKQGTRVLVSDRNVVVAELRQTLEGPLATQPDPVLSEWVGQGVVRVPLGPKDKLPISPVRSEDGITAVLLDQERAPAARTAMLFSRAYPDLTVLSLDHRITSNLEPLGLGL